MSRPASDIERALGQITRLQNPPRIDHPDDNINGVLLESFQLSKMPDRDEHSIDQEGIEALSFGPASDIGMKAFARFDEGREHLERSAFGRSLNLPNDRSEALLLHRQIAIRTILRAGFGKEETEKMVNFRNRSDSRFAAAPRHTLFDGDA